jgi:hypothetical protein
MFKISFDFDESTHKVSNIKVIEKQEFVEELKQYGEYDLQVLDNKIQLTSEAINRLGVIVGDRIAINY